MVEEVAPSTSGEDSSETDGKALISLIVPVYNEEDSLPTLYEQCRAALDELDHPSEILFVDDGSTDESGVVLRRLAETDETVTVISFRRNHGQTAAMMAGIDHARGDVFVTIDSDLQNDPADIPAMIRQLDEGYDVVSGWRKNRQDRVLTRKIPSQCANWVISKISGVKLHDYGCTLKVYRREVFEGVRLYGEMHRFVPIYAKMQGGRICEMPVNHRSRQFGESKYGLSRIYKVLLDLMLVKFLDTYSTKPIYVFGGFGLACLGASLIPGSLGIFFKIMPYSSGLHKDFVETPLPVMTALLILVGCLALLQGILAEMLMRTYYESQSRRPYLIKSIHSSHPDHKKAR